LRDRKKEIFVEKGNEDLFTDDFFLERLIEEETNRHLFSMVDSLPERTKEVLWMSLNGLKQKEISEELDVTIETVKSHKKLAYKILRKGVMIALVVFS
jgi:RNA polymerase sigma factor (sigma-70 family)